MKVFFVNYNTPRLTECAIRSLWKHTPEAEVVVFDNSDREPFTAPSGFPAGKVPVPCGFPQGQIEILDNTTGAFIDFDAALAQYPDKEYSQRNRSNFGSAKHSMSVDWLMDHYHDCPDFVLADSDVLFQRDITPLVNQRRAAVGSLQVKQGIPLLMPQLCYLNVPLLKAHGIRYFNGQKMWALSNRYPNNRYDTGAWLYEELINHRLSFRDTDINPYIMHFGHGSWKDKNPDQWLNDNKHLWI